MVEEGSGEKKKWNNPNNSSKFSCFTFAQICFHVYNTCCSVQCFNELTFCESSGLHFKKIQVIKTTKQVAVCDQLPPM